MVCACACVRYIDHRRRRPSSSIDDFVLFFVGRYCRRHRLRLPFGPVFHIRTMYDEHDDVDVYIVKSGKSESFIYLFFQVKLDGATLHEDESAEENEKEEEEVERKRKKMKGTVETGRWWCASEGKAK